MFCCRYEGSAGGPVDRDRRHYEGRHPVDGETGSHGCWSGSKITFLMLWLIKSSGADFGHVFLFAAGVAAVAIENTEGGKWIKENYKFSHCIPEELQSQVDGKYMNILKSFNK